MGRHIIKSGLVLLVLSLLHLTPVLAQGQALQPKPGATAALALLDGVWAGQARRRGADGIVESFAQTERIGPLLDGEIRLMEGSARDAEGRLLFQAFTVFAADSSGNLEMRSWIPGNVSSRVLALRPDGFDWSADTASGQLRYHITIADGVWQETGEIALPDGRVLPFFEMTLHRVADSDWPLTPYPVTP